MPERCRVFEQFDPTEPLKPATSGNVKVYPVEVCYMPQAKSWIFQTKYGWRSTRKTSFKIISVL